MFQQQQQKLMRHRKSFSISKQNRRTHVEICIRIVYENVMYWSAQSEILIHIYTHTRTQSYSFPTLILILSDWMTYIHTYMTSLVLSHRHTNRINGKIHWHFYKSTNSRSEYIEWSRHTITVLFEMLKCKFEFMCFRKKEKKQQTWRHDNDVP